MTQKKTDPQQSEKKRWKIAVLINILPFVVGIIGEVHVALFGILSLYLIFTIINILLLANVKRVIFVNLIMFASSAAGILLSTWLHYVNVSSDPMTPVVGWGCVFWGGYACFWITAISLSIYNAICKSKDKKPEQIREGKSLKRLGVNYIYVPKNTRDALDDTKENGSETA